MRTYARLGLLAAVLLAVVVCLLAQEAQTQGLEPVGKAETETSFLSNELLIKIKKEARGKVKEGNPADTGMTSLSEINKQLNVKKFEKIAKVGENSKKDAEIFAWYKITLEGKGEKITTELDKTSGKPNYSNPAARVLQRLIAKYRSDPNIETVEPNYIVNILATPNDPYFSSTGSWGQPYDDLWGLKRIQAEEAWDISTGSNQVTVAVIDTGIDYNHPDIQANIWTNTGEIPGNGIDDDSNGYVDDYYGYDFSNKDSDPIDDFGHGTHVAGTIGAVGNNGIGVVGVNWQAKIMAVKFLDSSGRGVISDAASSTVYAADNGAKVLSNSWVGLGTSSVISEAIEYAHSQNVVVVAGAGNDYGWDAMNRTPANDLNVITVSSTDHNDQISDFSNIGIKIDVAAPGGDSQNATANSDYVNILSLRASGTDMYGGGEMIVGTNYYRARGTSMATPHVSGLAALILSQHPDWTPEEIRHAIRNNTDKVSGKDFDINGTGYGRINAFKPLQAIDPPPVVRITSPSSYNRFVSARTVYVFSNNANVEMKGTVTSRIGIDNYSVFFGSCGSSMCAEEPTSYTLFASGNNQIENGILGLLDSTSIPNETYLMIKLVGEDTAGVRSEDRTIVYLVKISTEGTLPGWPQEIPAQGGTSGNGNDVNVDDLNGDGQKEIVRVTNYGEIGVWNNNGEILPGWPKVLEGLSIFASAIGNMDSQPDKEIVVAGSPYWEGNAADIYIFKKNGTPLDGWNPKSIPPDTTGGFLLDHGVPVISDLNNDRSNELVLFVEGLHLENHAAKVFVFNRAGDSFSENWPQRLDVGYTYGLGPAAVGDVDGDGQKEIVLAAGKIYASSPAILYIFKSDGSLSNKWSFGENMYLASSPSLADFDKDGKQEIVITSGFSGAAAKIWIFNEDGTLLPNWPQSTNPGYVSNAALGDLDEDGVAEIAVTSGGELSVWKADGTLLPGWPQLIHAGGNNDVALADVIGNSDIEIVSLGSDSGNANVRIWDPNGVLLDSKIIPGLGFSPVSSPVVADLDNNTSLEILVSGIYTKTWDGLLFIWQMDGSQLLPWPMSYHDPQRTGSVIDSDNDGFNDDRERYLGTDPFDACPDESGDPAWPPDFDNNRTVDILDVLMFPPHMGWQLGDPDYSARFDLNANQLINILDVLLMPPYMRMGICTN